MLIAAVGLMACALPSAVKAHEPAAPTSLEGSQEKPKPDVPNVIKLSLHPAQPPAAALEYPLLPRFIDQHPGNAATLYIKVTTLLADRKHPQEYWDKIDKWCEMPLADLPRGEVANLLVDYTTILDMVRMASRREQCDWGPPVHETTDIFGILIPEIGHLRNVGHLIALKARFQMAEGHTAEALETLQTGYALARQTADCPFLVCSLVGIAVANIMDQQVETLIQTSNCPNLYWSLTALPDPLVDLHPALALEADSLLLAFPELRDVERAHHSEEEWNAILAEFARRFKQLADVSDSSWSSLGTTAFMTARAALRLPKAKDDLVAGGRSRSAVDAMPVAQVILLDGVKVYKQTRDDMFKWFNVPYWRHSRRIRSGRSEAEERSPRSRDRSDGQLAPACLGQGPRRERPQPAADRPAAGGRGDATLRRRARGQVARGA